MNVVAIRKVSKGVKQQQEFKITSAGLLNLKDDLEKLKMTREDDKTRVGQENKEIKLKMQGTARKIQENLVTLMQKCNQKLNTKYQEFEKDINNDVKDLEEALEKVNQAIKGLEEDENDAFINMKSEKNIAKDTKKVIQGISEHARKETLQFALNPKLAAALGTKEFGTLSFKNQRIPPKPRLFHEVCEYTASLKNTCNVNINHDAKSCHILDSCLLYDGTLVLTDLSHNSLVHLDEAFKIKGVYGVSGEPWGVCTTRMTEIAVTLISNKAVQLVSTEKEFVLKNSFKIGLPCRGIICKDGYLYVCCAGGSSSYWFSMREGPGQIRVYTLQGIHQYTFQNDEEGKAIFGRPRDIVINPENNLFYITDETYGIIILSRSGHKLSAITDRNLTAARGIAFDTRGQMFVGCLKSCQVFLFADNGTLIQTLLTKTLGIKSVRSLCFKAENYKLIVTGFQNDIQIFDLTRH